MASTTSCRLCSFACSEFKCLYQDDGEINEVYQIAVKYFSPSLLDAETESNDRVICLECWQHISDFYSFQQWILSAQAQQTDYKIIIHSENSDSVNIKDDEIDFSFLKCDQCDELFHSHASLNAHYELLHPGICANGNSDIKLIQKSTPPEDFKEINQIERNENSYKCETCGASFSHYGNLRRHVRKKHMAEPLLKWVCKYCNKMFRKRSNLERHKTKLHKSDHEKTDDECNYKKNFELERSVNTFNQSENVCISKETTIKKSDIGNDNLKRTCYNTRFSKKKDIDAKNIRLDIAGHVKSSSAQKDPNTQIHMPAIDIVDIKDELAMDQQSDEDLRVNKGKNNFYSDLSSDTDEYDEDLVIKWKGYFECPRCSEHVRKYSELSEHFARVHPEERCYVNCCHLTLYNEESIEEHLQFHENPRVFECTECAKSFKNKRGLNSHKLQVHGDNRSTYHLHLCYCKRAKKRINEHRQMEYDTFICCPRKKKILEDDALIANWKKELICHICRAKFAYYSLMRVHFYREHPGEKCHILCCQRKMSRISDALQHIRFHLDPHAYRCKACNLDFSGKNTLAKHMRNSHTDSLPKHMWACDECDKTFQIRQILTRHKNVHHSKKV